jgi:hypothetical protein
MKVKFLIGGWVAVLSVWAQPPGGGRQMDFLRGGRGMMQQVVTGAPYSAVEVRTSQQVLANGNLIQRQERSNVYRDSQGRTRIETTRQRPGGPAEAFVTIADPVAGVVHDLNVTTKTVFARPARFQPAAGAMPRNPGGRFAAADVKHETLAAQSINGVLASGSRVTHTIAAGAIGNSQPIEIVRETWISDDLKAPVMTKTSDPRTGTTVTQLTNINRSEPDASLFLVPADYSVRQTPGPGMGPRGRGPGTPPPAQN